MRSKDLLCGRKPIKFEKHLAIQKGVRESWTLLRITLFNFSWCMDMHGFALVYTNLSAAGFANFACFASFGGPGSRTLEKIREKI